MISHTLWSKIKARMLFLVAAFGGVTGTGTVCAAGPVACRLASGCAASSGAERLVLPPRPRSPRLPPVLSTHLLLPGGSAPAG